MKYRNLAACTLLSTGLLSGCNMDGRLTFSPEDKINAAFPVSEAVRFSQVTLLEQASPEQRDDIQRLLKSRLRLRALECAKDYTPPWYASLTDIREKLGDSTCFTDADAALQTWLGLRRAGMQLSQPALRAIPSTVPPYIVASSTIQNARFADKAGVALLEARETLEVMDLGANKAIHRAPKDTSAVGRLSANGRLYTVGLGQRLQIRESATGTTLADIPSVYPHEFHWLDDRTALYERSDNRKTFLLDFVSGEEVELPMIQRGLTTVAAAPGTPNQFVVFGHQQASRIEVIRGTGKPEVRLVSERNLPRAINWSANTSGVLPGGKHAFEASRQLTVINLEDLQAREIQTEPLYIQQGSATPDADKIIIRGYVQGVPTHGGKDYVFSLSANTLSEVNSSELPSRQFTYVPSVNRQAVISDSKITLLDSLPTLPPVPLSNVLAALVDAANQHKLEMFSREQAMQDTMLRAQQTRDAFQNRLMRDEEQRRLEMQARQRELEAYQARRLREAEEQRRQLEAERRMRRDAQMVRP